MQKHSVTYSTAEIARKLGIHKLTLLRWLYSGLLPEPRHAKVGRLHLRVWTPKDLARARKFKAGNYRIATVKGRGRPKKDPPSAPQSPRLSPWRP